MRNRILCLLFTLFALVFAGCGDSEEDITRIITPVNPGGQVNTTFLRVAHLVPAAQNYDVYVNNRLTLTNITYGQFTDYLAVPANARIRVTRVNNQSLVFVDRTLNLPAAAYSTLAITGTPTDVVSTLYTDNITAATGTSTIRLVNSSSGNNSVSLTRTDGTLVVGSVDFPNATNYVDVAPGNYNLQIRDLQDNVLIELPNVNFVANTNYSVYVAGQDASNTLGAVIAVDSTTQGVNNGAVVTP
jgi:hypothetical protein